MNERYAKRIELPDFPVSGWVRIPNDGETFKDGSDVYVGDGVTSAASLTPINGPGGGGGGTVTSVGISGSNGIGVSGSPVTTSGTIALSLGAITPTSVAATGNVTGANLSGANTGDQTSVTGNAGTATALQTARNINGTSFNGTADITVTAAAGTLTGNTLAAGVTASSLTSAAGGAFGTAAYVNTGTGSSDVPTIAQADARYVLQTSFKSNVLGSNFATSSATYVDVTGSSVTLDASSTYLIHITGSYQSANTSTGVGVSMTMTNSPTFRSFDRRVYTVATTATDNTINADDGGAIATTVDIANTNRNFTFTGTVTTAGSSSVLQLRAARGGTSNNVTIMAGAIIAAHKIS